MVLSSNIIQYINNSKIKGQLCRWNKSVINIYVTQISANISNKEFMYSQVDRAFQAWNLILKQNNINVLFQKVLSPNEADITVHWVKVGRVYEGMCKYLSVIGNSIKKISIEIGLPNEFSGKEVTDLSIYCAIMHEFGHALGLGHGVDADDIMFVPHQKNISVPSENDLYVLKEIYK
ncbi:matrixin family metalloprotease [bacterium]|nr:matrixin family metalloprotease [bacterium]